jgi:hypothetical protein
MIMSEEFFFRRMKRDESHDIFFFGGGMPYATYDRRDFPFVVCLGLEFPIEKISIKTVPVFPSEACVSDVNVLIYEF